MDEPVEQTLDESIEVLIAQLPAPIRKVFQGDTISDVSRQLYTKYQLHVDQAAVLRREIILLLLGVKNPTEFVDALENEGQIPHEVVGAITTDVNQMIFVPLQEQMRAYSEQGEQQAAPAAVVAPTGVPPVSRPAPAAAAPNPPAVPAPRPLGEASIPAPRPPVPAEGSLNAPQSQFHLINKIQQPPAPSAAQSPFVNPAVLPVAPPQANPMPRPATPSAPLPPKAAMPYVPSQAPAPRMASPVIAPQAPVTPSAPPRAAAPRFGQPPPNLPGTVPLTPRPAPPPSGTYSVDPYREMPE